MPADKDLIEDVRQSLRALADPDKAPAMQAYMKSAMPYYGVPEPLTKRVFAQATVPQKIFSGEGYLPFPEGGDLRRSKYFWF